MNSSNLPVIAVLLAAENHGFNRRDKPFRYRRLLDDTHAARILPASALVGAGAGPQSPINIIVGDVGSFEQAVARQLRRLPEGVWWVLRPVVEESRQAARSALLNRVDKIGGNLCELDVRCLAPPGEQLER